MESEIPLIDATREVRDLLATSQNLAAVEVAHAALRGIDTLGAKEIELGYLYALASARSGAPGAAAQMIERLRAANPMDRAISADIESLAGRVAKDAFVETGEKAALLAAINAYQRADGLCQSIHARINAASMLRIAGQNPAAEKIALAVLEELAAARNANTHWDEATRGEAALLLGLAEDACRHYREAHRRAGRRVGDIASMRRQLQLLSMAVPDAARALAEIPGPRVIAFSGHMIDAPNRTVARFPANSEDAVKAAIDRIVATLAPAIGYAQAAPAAATFCFARRCWRANRRSISCCRSRAKTTSNKALAASREIGGSGLTG